MRRTQVGVTLIELLVAVAIVGILAAIAYPNYRQYALRGNRTEGKAELMEVAQELEKCYTRYGAYNDGNCFAFTQVNGDNRWSEARRYRVRFQEGGITTNTYTLQAVPQEAQAVDSCGTLTLDETGQRSSATPADTKCW